MIQLKDNVLVKTDVIEIDKHIIRVLKFLLKNKPVMISEYRKMHLLTALNNYSIIFRKLLEWDLIYMTKDEIKNKYVISLYDCDLELINKIINLNPHN